RHTRFSRDWSSDVCSSDLAPGAERTEAQVMNAMISPDLLVIDEVGATKPTEFEQATLFHVINSRYEQMRPTVVISNLDPHELPEIGRASCRERGGRLGVSL